jgi:hypothetical protein
VNRSQLRALQHRIDALRRKCSTGYGCGSTCISLRKECRVSPGSSIGKAQEIIRGMGSKLDRAAVVRWAALKANATGREREAIGWMSEVFYPLAQSESDRRWLGAFLSGIPAAVREAEAQVGGDGSLEARAEALRQAVYQ